MTAKNVLESIIFGHKYMLIIGDTEDVVMCLDVEKALALAERYIQKGYDGKLVLVRCELQKLER